MTDFDEKNLTGLDQERLRTFICAMDSGGPDWLDKLEEEAIREDVPIIRRDTQSLLKTLLQLSRPARILEVGTATGFSALLMAHYTGKDTTITTIEKYEVRIPIAKEHFAAYDTDNKITLLEGDALEILGSLEGEYDFIFMDAAKGQYPAFFEDAVRLLAPGGLLVSDNVLQDGDVVESRFAVTRRNRTIHARMREYLHTLTHDERLVSSILTVGDGVALSVKK
ncbi:O-methyltransferase [Butyrivibrio sp. MC2013]|uniref:O-methyltransferase n=1 Tax=Butyrivibrio sp. MC2013 TaxID=1280686 RepID=UPI0004151789|nr:O-methyltransferase [Butyrivibrio sp. MC2013]